MFAKFASNSRFSCYSELEKHLDRLGQFHMDFGLERIQTVLQLLFPEGYNFKLAQVVGTNGKGSTATFLASVAKAHAIKSGLFTSPHLLSLRERVHIDAKMLSEEEWTCYANIVDAAQSKIEKEQLTYFEFVFALALVAFAKGDVGFAVLEAGLGGEFDATSAIFSDILIFTPISFDHEHILGAQLSEIASTKAGAIKPDQMLLTAEQEPEVLTILKSIAHEKGNKLLKTSVAPHFKYPLGLLGYQQKDNAMQALGAYSMLAKKFGWPLRKPAMARGLKRAHLPGRLQVVPPLFERPALLLDGAHNLHAFDALERNLDIYGIRPRAIIFSCMTDKNLDSVFHKLADWTEGPIFIPPIKNNPRAVDPTELASKIGPKAIPVNSLKEALGMIRKLATPALPLPRQPKYLPDDLQSPILICGSLYLLGDFFELHPGLLAPAR